MTDFCCVSFLNPTLSANVSSITEINLPEPPTAPATIFPVVAENQVYCKLSNLGGAKAYKELYLKPDGLCHEEIFRCTFPSLFIYAGTNCTGVNVTYPMSYSMSLQVHPFTSNFRLQLVNITGTKGKVGYTFQTPQTLLAMGTGEPSEVLAAILLAFLVTIEIGLFSYFAYRYYKLRKVSGLILVIAHFFWLIFLGVYISYLYTLFQGRTDLTNSLASWQFFFAVGNFTTALYTANFIAIFWNFGKLQTILLYGGVFLTHIGLMGSYYIVGSIYYDVNVKSSYDRALEIWGNQVYNAWTLILFIWDTVPICVILARAAFGIEGGWIKKIIGALKRDMVAAGMFCLQFPIAIGFLVNEVVRSSTYLLGNDRNYQASRVYSVLFVVLHCLLNTIIIYRVAMKVQTSQISTSNKGATNSAKKTTSGVTQSQGAASSTGRSTKGTETEN